MKCSAGSMSRVLRLTSTASGADILKSVCKRSRNGYVTKDGTNAPAAFVLLKDESRTEGSTVKSADRCFKLTRSDSRHLRSGSKWMQLNFLGVYSASQECLPEESKRSVMVYLPSS